jgi:hypothetical protein
VACFGRPQLFLFLLANAIVKEASAQETISPSDASAFFPNQERGSTPDPIDSDLPARKKSLC